MLCALTCHSCNVTLMYNNDSLYHCPIACNAYLVPYHCLHIQDPTALTSISFHHQEEIAHLWLREGGGCMAPLWSRPIRAFSSNSLPVLWEKSIMCTRVKFLLVVTPTCLIDNTKQYIASAKWQPSPIITYHTVPANSGQVKLWGDKSRCIPSIQDCLITWNFGEWKGRYRRGYVSRDNGDDPLS